MLIGRLVQDVTIYLSDTVGLAKMSQIGCCCSPSSHAPGAGHRLDDRKSCTYYLEPQNEKNELVCIIKQFAFVLRFPQTLYKNCTGLQNNLTELIFKTLNITPKSGELKDLAQLWRICTTHRHIDISFYKNVSSRNQLCILNPFVLRSFSDTILLFVLRSDTWGFTQSCSIFFYLICTAFVSVYQIYFRHVG